MLVQSGANVLILDEPTNHLDLESREALESALQQFPGALLLISHDRALLDAVGTRTIAVEDRHAALLRRRLAGVRARARGARRGRARGEGAREGQAQGRRPRAQARAPRHSRAASKNQERQARRLEAEIEQAEAELAAIEHELADPQAWNDPRSAEKSTRRHAEAKRARRRALRRARGRGGLAHLARYLASGALRLGA